MRTLIMNQKLHDILALHIIPGLFRLRGGKEIWLDKNADLSRLGVESTLVEAAHDITFEETWDWNTLPMGEEGSGLPARRLAAETVHFRDSYVYKLDRATCGDCTKRWGVVVLPGSRVLLTGFSRQRFHLGVLVPRNPFRIRREKIILCPQPYPGGTYGDVLNVTLPRLCRILMVMPEKEKAEACVAMPFGMEIIHQLVERLGIPRERHIDSTRECFGLTRDGWAYTCNTPLKVMATEKEYHYMRDHLCPQHKEAGKRRIYIKREKTRRILGEEQYLPYFAEQGFEIFDDTPRTLDEQMAFFHGAEIVAGAHGAGQVNMLWANPDVKMLEARDGGLWLNCFRLWSIYNKAPHLLLVDWTRHSEPAWAHDSFYEDLVINPKAYVRAYRELMGS